ncbi:MAG: hypothetical protein AB1410_06360 [Acidobacteriota bacterium]
MKVAVDKKLFWYMKEEAKLDLQNPSHVDMYVQQVLSYGKAENIKKMLKILTSEKFVESFERIKRFLPNEVRIFWEDGLGDTGKSPKRDTQLP